MPSSPRNLKAAAWGWRSAVPSWNRMVAACGLHPTTDEARRFISLCQPQSWKCLRQYDSQFDWLEAANGTLNCLRGMSECRQERPSHPPSISEAVLSPDLLSGETSALHHRASLR